MESSSICRCPCRCRSRQEAAAAHGAEVDSGEFRGRIRMGHEVPSAVAISSGTITLGAFLKLARAASSGGAAKLLIQRGEVTVNGSVELRRHTALRAGDKVGVSGGRIYVLVGKEGV